MSTMKIEPKAVGRRIREVRVGAGLSGEEFGERIGVGKGAVSTYEIGESFPRWETLNRILALSGRDFNWLLGGEDAAGGAAVPQAGGVPGPDQGVLADVLQGIEEGLSDLELEIPPAKKAELVVLLYEMMLEEEGAKPRKSQIERILKLVA